jgi:hypothetical protein
MERRLAIRLVMGDILSLKVMSAEVVAQQALDMLSRNLMDPLLHAGLEEHIREEFEHMSECRNYLIERGEAGPSPSSHVAWFRMVMRIVGAAPRRSRALVTATLLCTAIEASAIPQVAKLVREPRLHGILASMGEHELRHYDCTRKALAARADDSLYSKFVALITVITLGFVAVVLWWPRISPAYRSLGLRPEVFARELCQRLAASFRFVARPWCRQLVHKLIMVSTSIGERPGGHETRGRLPV